MKYADNQLVRPQHENGCDYGHGRRSVLVQNGKKQLLHIASAKHWGGIGAGRYSSPSEIVVYPHEGGACKQWALANGRMDKKKWNDIAEHIYTHLGVKFPMKLISLKHTLLLDEPGEVDGPPPPDESKPKKVHPRIESDKLYRIFQEEGKCQLAEADIIKQGGGKITYRLSKGREIEKRTKDILEEGGGGTVDEAVAGYLRHYKEQLAAGAVRLQQAAESYAYYKDNLTEAEHRIEEMIKGEK
jgi:hypothetical protein